MAMAESDVLALLGEVGAVLVDDHFVLTSGRHSSVYINKDAVYPQILAVSALCEELALRFPLEDYGIETVVGLVVGGVILSQWVAYYLPSVRRPVYPLALFADKQLNPRTGNE